MDELEKMKQRLTAKRQRGSNEPNWELGLSTGSTILNLACSGRPNVGFPPDYYYVWCGRSGSGKTFITLTTLAEASIHPAYKDHKLIFDCPENGALMNVEKYYGLELANRLQPPAGTREKPRFSNTLESFYHNVHNAISSGPCVYLLDSMDPLPTDNELRDFLKKNKKRLKREENNKIPLEEAGSYGTERARVNSSHLRLIFNELRGSNSILIVIFQSRQTIGFGSQFNPDTRGGGVAPTFYAGLELWSKVAGALKTTYKEKTIEQGVVCQVKVKKGRLTGRSGRTVEIPIYHSFGIDDIGGMVDYLVEWKHWGKTGKEFDSQKGKIDASDFKVTLSREKLVQHILTKGLEPELKLIVTEVWNEIEDACSVKRKSRYRNEEGQPEQTEEIPTEEEPKLNEDTNHE